MYTDEGSTGITFERNIIVWKTGRSITGPWDKALTTTANNCWFNLAVEPVNFLGKSLSDWQAAGHETGSIVADPRLGDAARGFQSAPGSPALALGFVPFDPSKAGVYGDPEWVKLAASWKHAPVEAPPAPRGD